MEYKIITSPAARVFERLVTNKIKQGWKLQGGVSSRGGEFVQAIIKEETTILETTNSVETTNSEQIVEDVSTQTQNQTDISERQRKRLLGYI